MMRSLLARRFVRYFLRGCAAGCLALPSAGSLHAQELRDPTAPPAALVAPAVGSASSPAREAPGGVIVRNGTPYLVVGTRLVAVGQQVGAAKLERITETDIWLREAGKLRKVPRFDGIQRRPAKEPNRE